MSLLNIFSQSKKYNSFVSAAFFAGKWFSGLQIGKSEGQKIPFYFATACHKSDKGSFISLEKCRYYFCIFFKIELEECGTLIVLLTKPSTALSLNKAVVTLFVDHVDCSSVPSGFAVCSFFVWTK